MRFIFVVIIASRIYLTLSLSSDRMVKEILPAWEKSKKHSVREFLYTLSRPNAPLGQVDDVCLALLDSYERARYGAQVRCEMTYHTFVPKICVLISWTQCIWARKIWVANLKSFGRWKILAFFGLEMNTFSPKSWLILLQIVEISTPMWKFPSPHNLPFRNNTIPVILL